MDAIGGEAAHAGHEKVVQVLCEAGADKDAYTCPAFDISDDGKTPLHMGLKHPKVINVLLKTSARDEAQSVNCCAALPGKTPLELATSLGSKGLIPKKSVTLLEKASQARATPAALSTAAPSDPPSNSGGSSSSSGDGATGSSGGGATEETNAATDEKGNGAESKTNKRKRA